MKYKHLFPLILAASAALPAAAQVNDPGPVTVQTDKRPVGYVPIREADLMWAKRIWRVIDLREKMNQIYLYPLVPNNERINLISIIKQGIGEGVITPYDPVSGDDFQVEMDRKTALAIGSSVDTIMIPEANPPYIEHPVPIVTEFDPFTVKRYKIKEDWFFDSKRSVMEVRIIAICPVMEVYDATTGELRGLQDMYWIDFEQARTYLSGFKVYNPNNFAQRISYDDAFRIRLFSSLIYKQDNTHDRRVDEYMAGIDALYEAEDIKNNIMEFEHDLWEY